MTSLKSVTLMFQCNWKMITLTPIRLTDEVNVFASMSVILYVAIDTLAAFVATINSFTTIVVDR